MKRLTVLTLSTLTPALLAAQAPQSGEPASSFVPQPATTLPLKHAPQPTKGAITAADLMTRLYIFADDSMLGREAGTIGNVKGTDYIASEVKRLGLQPAGENGGYFQTLPFKTRQLAAVSRLTIAGTPLVLGTDWAASAGMNTARSDIPVVYGGAIGDSASMIAPEQAAGKLVVFTISSVPGAARQARAIGRRYGGAAAVGVVSPQLMAFARRPATFVDDPSAAARPVTVPTVYLTEGAAAQLLGAPLAGMATGTAGKAATLELVVDVQPVAFPTRNVVAILPGRDRKLAGEYVAIGAHNDHVGFNHAPVDHDSLRIYNHLVRPGGAEDGGKQATPEQQAEINGQLAAWRAAHPGTQRLDSIYNGADDDGSGSVSVLEIAEHYASLTGDARPKRSILFVWHVGEEKGLLGSAYFTDHPTVPRDSIVAQLNIDMDGRGNAWDVAGLTKEGQSFHGGPNYLQLVGSRRLSSELGNMVEQVNKDGRYGFTFDYAMDANGHPMNIYCRSDHYEYARYGIPITFFTTGGHSDYHQVTDEPEYIDYARMERTSKLVADIALRVANLDHRIAVDQPKPDPRGACRQ